MKSCFTRLGLLCAVCVAVVNCFSLDREAFTLTSYDLNVRVEPEQQRLGVRGKITLRNDSAIPQKIATLQISSSLDWRSIKTGDKPAGDKPLQFVTQAYTSDIDHTGALSEALVTLPEAVPPKGVVELEIAYEGVIVLDATRLTRIDAPEDAARSTDWDQISTKFTAVRGAGYVAWYPIATEAANLSEDNSLFDVLDRWKAREAGSAMDIAIADPSLPDAAEPTILCSGEVLRGVTKEGTSQFRWTKCSYHPLGLAVPTLVFANYKSIDGPSGVVFYFPGDEAAAKTYAEAAESVMPFVAEWFGIPRSKAQTADLPDPNAAPFESGSFLLTPLTGADSKRAGLAAAHQLTHAAFFSLRPWINEGLAHFAQALYLEHQSGRQSALNYIGLHRSALSAAESEKQKQAAPLRSEDEVNRSLVNTSDEELYRSKAMCVWWMLRDMLGDAALKNALASYHPEQDKEPSYMPRLIQAQTQRDLEWFFDDWVYRDRGLPDFKVESVFPRKTLTEGYMLTITVNNLGTAGAEVPLTVKFAGGEITKRIEVRAKSNAVIRVEVSALPAEIVVNDGSVPESDTTNNTFKVEANEAPK
jgi:hypothetical protein